MTFWTVQNFTFLFAGTFTSYQCSLSFQDLNYKMTATTTTTTTNNDDSANSDEGVTTAITDLKVNITIAPCDYYINGLTACLYSTSLHRLNTMRTRYLVLDAAFSKVTFYKLSYIVSGLPKMLNITVPIITEYQLSPITFGTGTINNFLIINGLNVTSISGKLDLKATALRTSSTGLRLNISTTCTTNIRFMSMSFTLASWNIE